MIDLQYKIVYALFGLLIVLLILFFPIYTYVIDLKCYKEKHKMDPLDMMLDGWCNDCDQDPAKCIEQGKCLGEKED